MLWLTKNVQNVIAHLANAHVQNVNAQRANANAGALLAKPIHQNVSADKKRRRFLCLLHL